MSSTRHTPPENRIPVVLATGNPDKVRELRPMMKWASPLFSVRSLADLAITADVEETENTLEGNALLKADAIFRLVGKRYPYVIVLADDTGLEVEALCGEPGVFSARFAPVPEGAKPSYDDNVRHLLLRMEGMNDRTATFRTVIAMKGRIPSGTSMHEFRCSAEGAVQGSITFETKGMLGFGYDPVFHVHAAGKTYAEMTTAEKNTISHRALALRNASTMLAGIMANHYSPET